MKISANLLVGGKYRLGGLKDLYSDKILFIGSADLSSIEKEQEWPGIYPLVLVPWTSARRMKKRCRNK